MSAAVGDDWRCVEPSLPVIAPDATAGHVLVELSPTSVQETVDGHRNRKRGIVSIAAFTHHSTPDRVLRFEFKLRNGKSLFSGGNASVINTGALQPAGQWDLLEGESIACAHALATHHGSSPSAWIFETNTGRMSIVFGKASANLRVQTFALDIPDAVIGVKRLQIATRVQSALPIVSGIECPHDGALSYPYSSLHTVNIETSSHGVNAISFMHQPEHSSKDTLYGVLGTGVSSELFTLLDPGNASAEVVVEVVCVQDEQRLHALQLVTNRSRRSSWRLNSEWKTTRRDTLDLIIKDVSYQLSIEAVAASMNAGAEQSSVLFDFFESAEKSCDCGCSERVSKVCSYCWIYVFGVIIVALFAYGCTATAYTYSYSTTLGIWLGVFLPCAAICGLFGSGLYIHRGVIIPSLFAGTCFVGLLVGLIGGIYFLGPWWMLTRLDTAYSVDAAALDLIGNNTIPSAGIFYFQPSAFVNQDRYGYFVVSSKRTGSSYFCTAPVVSSSTQARVVYWVTDDGSCCASSSTSCWNSFSSPGSISGAYLQVRRPEFIESVYADARTAACARLASLNANYSAASICALPAVYLKLDPTPEATRDSLYTRGMVYVGVMTGLWPFVLVCMSLGMVLLPRGWRKGN